MSIASTVVTACDHRFVWGAMLLGLSLRFHGMESRYHITGYDLSDDDIYVLQGIPGTVVIPVDKTDMRSVCTQKPLSIFSAETETIVWMDADCLVNGNVEKYFVCPEGRLQIRFRGVMENASVYRNYYGHDDEVGDIPKRVLAKWKTDVSDKQVSAISTVCQTNCFVLQKNHLPFIRLWQQQMEKVIPAHTRGVYSKSSLAYSMTDESVLNSLLAFSSQAPETSEYLMDKDPLAYCIHFGLNPKPWQHWTKQAFSSYQQIQDLIQWARLHDIRLPDSTASLLPENKSKEYFWACLRAALEEYRYKLSSFGRVTIRMFK